MGNRCMYRLQSDALQKELERKVELLLQGVLATKSAYEKEKAIDAFAQTFLYLEAMLLYKHGVHREQIDLIKISVEPAPYFNKIKEIEQTVLAEMNRSFRNFMIFS